MPLGDMDMTVKNSLTTVLGLLALMLGFQNCSLQDSGSGSFSSKSAEPYINPLPDVQDNIYIPPESAAGSAEQQQSAPAPEGSVEQLLERGLISESSFRAVSNYKTVSSYIRPTLDSKNACDHYPVAAFDGAKSSKCTEPFIESINQKIDLRDKEAYLFSMYNATNSSHGPGTERHIVEMPIIIPSGTKPVELYLKAYEPTSWKLTGAVERVTAVRAFGYHCQMVTGAPANAEIHVSSYEQGYSSFHRDLRDMANSGDTDFLFILRVFVSSDMARMFHSYDRECLGEFVASP